MLIEKIRSFFSPWWSRPLFALSVGACLTTLLLGGFPEAMKAASKGISDQIQSAIGPTEQQIRAQELSEELRRQSQESQERMAKLRETPPPTRGKKKRAQDKANEADEVKALAPMHAKRETLIDISAKQLVLTLSVVVVISLWLALSAFAGRIYRKRMERILFLARDAERRRRESVIRHNERIDYYRQFPLADHTLCSTCGWIGLFRSNAPTYDGAKAIGTAAAVGGTGLAAAGCGGSALGIILILIGLPLLFLFCIGVIPIGIGIFLIIAGGTATTAGATVAASGASSAAGATQAAQRAAAAPNQCPQCKNVGLIPALSPMGVHQIENTPTVAAAAQAESIRVIEGLPSVIDIELLPTLEG
ncbi:hypothetical protein [Geothrix sp. PMB-07]|uniref:hypothetical protein n=1 Tax=Geothrix sp. PMB-07 TaxID=3068640 RepID=UPI002741DCD2|nr:hypothetical protein [Geothrix sp. PMB-07]WLT30637.1 hypothetical protein Q9293_13025 [Geothrix sp. PMB-07]WLT32767.1 hypothetical protein Q9293_05395 [Geothrix sp. PMB-07]